MRKRSRIVRIGKWAGLGACVVVLALWLVNLWYAVSINLPMTRFRLSESSLWVTGPGQYVEFCYRDLELVHVARYSHKPKMLPVVEGTLVRPSGIIRAWFIGIPIWMLFVGIAVPTVLLWRRDKRIPKGHCQNCGYNLRGDVFGRCPECGKPT